MLADRLASSRKRLGLSQAKLAAAMGERYSQSNISHIEAGRVGLAGEGLSMLARALGVSIDYLYGLTDDPTPAAELSRGANLDAPEIAQVAAVPGSGMRSYDDTVIGWRPFEREWLRDRGIDPGNCSLVKVQGDLMEPTLPDGCVVLVDRSLREPHDGGIYVMETEEGLLVKRVGRHEGFGGWALLSDKWKWPPVPFTDDVHIIGRVRQALVEF